MSWIMVGSISLRKAKPPGKVCARAGPVTAATVSATINAFTKPLSLTVMAGIGRPPGIKPDIGAEMGAASNGFFTLNVVRPGENSPAPYSALPHHPSLPIALVLMTTASKSTFVLGHRHLLGIEGLSAAD